MLMLGRKAQSYVSVQPPYSFKAKVNVAGPEGPVGEEGMGGTGNGRVGGVVVERCWRIGRKQGGVFCPSAHTEVTISRLTPPPRHPTVTYNPGITE